MKKNNLIFIFLFAIISIFQADLVKSAELGEQLRALPVQDAGRIKPFDSFAREMLEIVHGKQTYKTEQGKSEAYIIVMTWILSPDAWQDNSVKFFECRNHEVLNRLGLDKDQRYFSGQELFGSEKFNELRGELQEKRDSKEKLTPYFQALQRLENQFFIFQELAAGRMIKPLPAKEGTTWVSVADFDAESQVQFMKIAKNFSQLLGALAQKNENTDDLKKNLDQSVLEFRQFAESQNPTYYKHVTDKVDSEVQFNLFHPFRWSYVFYLIAAFVFIFAWITKKNYFNIVGWGALLAGFVLHNYGFAIRVYLTERPPVSNMYETVVWVAWGAIVFAFILNRLQKNQLILIAGTIVTAFSMVVADTAPAVLNPTLQPLEAVLRSNYWLIVHVMTITISYAAFFLAFGLGDLGLYYYLRDEDRYQEQIKMVVQSIYRSIQIGVVFLAPGIILGGVWADESWGRFWGWDPKETWALIALLGYLAVLHARIAGMLKNFGMIVTSVISFSLIIMAWYGVNFVLGAGLHSYGFGAGGVEYVSVFLVAHFMFVIWVVLKRKSVGKM